jgi:RNA polymerase sigma-70 factor (ECF subfamily)
VRNFRSDLVALLPRLRRFAYGLCGAAHEADDLVQEAVERALRSETRFRPDSALDSWMYKIVQNLWRDRLRRGRTAGGFETIEVAAEVVGMDGRRIVEVRDAAAKALAALGRLPQEIRSAAMLVIVNGASYAEAAAALDVPIGTIMSRVARARKGLETALSGPVSP